jgi:hypothetical protein
MSDYTYNLTGAQIIFSLFDFVVPDLNYGEWQFTLLVLEVTVRIFCSAPRARMRNHNFVISHPNDIN